MACTDKPLWALKRGASFDLTVRIPSKFADGHFTGWVVQSAVRTPKGGLVAALTAQWVDPVTARLVHLQCLDTRAWPLGAAEFDVVFESPSGFRWPSSTYSFEIVRGPTDA